MASFWQAGSRLRRLQDRHVDTRRAPIRLLAQTSPARRRYSLYQDELVFACELRIQPSHESSSFSAMRAFLRNRHNVVRAYLFMGAFDLRYQGRYLAFQDCGYPTVFREHGVNLEGKKKGNVGVDIVFEMMRDNFTNSQMEKAILVSGDGDYFRTVEHLIEAGKFDKVLLPTRKNTSSLYKRLSNAHFITRA